MLNRNFDTITGHTIVCGYGRNGKQTVKELISHDQIVLVIENNAKEIEELQHFPEVYYLVGDATKDEVLNTAGINTARAIITTLPKDADNLFVVITARIFKQDIPIVSRASEPQSQKKLYSAGANFIIMPDKLGGQRMADLVIEPDVVEFIDYILLQDKEQTNLEEISVAHLNKSFIKKTIRELNIRNVSESNIIGLKTKQNKYILNPSADYSLDQASHIFALGTPTQIKKLKNLIIFGGNNLPTDTNQ
ncbi:MAG: NAD-binding protein [Salinivirgaceae bacterium]|jgi:voltage-gated potassium channel|nr:NAD-binding protein [Salinivirgaceae bacterium]